jgi:hypothetical protein
MRILVSLDVSIPEALAASHGCTSGDRTQEPRAVRRFLAGKTYPLPAALAAMFERNNWGEAVPAPPKGGK